MFRSSLSQAPLIGFLLWMGLSLASAPAGAHPFAYVVDNSLSVTFVLDTKTNTVVAVVPVGCEDSCEDGDRVFGQPLRSRPRIKSTIFLV